MSGTIALTTEFNFFGFSFFSGYGYFGAEKEIQTL